MKDTKVGENKARDFYLSREDAAKVLAACSNAQWRLLFALCRFGGLRCPSEPAALKWTDIDWDRNRVTVHSPKTEHHEGHESRVVPIFPELRPHLEAAFAEAKDKTGFVLMLACMQSKTPNPRTTMFKIVKRAGLKPWPKMFHNLRATRQTELAAEGFAEPVVCDWIGNS